MVYLRFLTLSKDVDALKAKGYIRITKEGTFKVPGSVMRSLKDNKAVVPEPTEGLDTGRILSRIRRVLSIREDDELTTREAQEELDYLMLANPDTSIARVYDKYFQDRVSEQEHLVFYALLYRYYYQDDDQVGWNDIDDYFDEDELDNLRALFSIGALDLQAEGIIEYAGTDGMLTKDCFKIKDGIKEEALVDVGGLKKKRSGVTASRKIESGSITPKELVYNAGEGRQVDQLKDLMGEDRFNGIRTKMKDSHAFSTALPAPERRRLSTRLPAAADATFLSWTYPRSRVAGWGRVRRTSRMCSTSTARRFAPGELCQSFFSTRRTPFSESEARGRAAPSTRWRTASRTSFSRRWRTWTES